MKEFKGTPAPKWIAKETPNDDDFAYEVQYICAVYRDGNSLANATLIAAAPDLLKACMDYENPTSQTVADCLRELSNLLPQNESKWIEWCDKQADVIESAITKALTI